MGWGRYLLAIGGVVVGLAALEAAAPRATLPMVALLLIGVAISHPTFASEMRAIGQRFFGV